MKRALLLAGIFLAVAAFLWWLVPVAPTVPLAARFLYRTNLPSGELRYVVALTNVGPDAVTIYGTGELLVAGVWRATGPPGATNHYWAYLSRHDEKLLACVSEEPGRRVRITYHSWTRWMELRHRAARWIAAFRHSTGDVMPYPDAFVMDVPTE